MDNKVWVNFVFGILRSYSVDLCIFLYVLNSARTYYIFAIYPLLVVLSFD